MVMNLCQRRSDLELVWASAKGDERAFQRLYERHRRRVYSIGLRILGNTAEAEDLAREVFISAYQRVSTMGGDPSFTTWLHRLTVNAILRRLREHETGQKAGVAHQESLTTQTGQCRAERIAPIDRSALEAAIAQLPTDYRLAFVLHDVEGFDSKEIARMLRISPDTFRSQLHQARVRVRQLLKGTTAARV